MYNILVLSNNSFSESGQSSVLAVCMKKSKQVLKLMLTVSNPCLLQVWLDEDVELYDFAKVRPLIKKKQIMVKKTSLQSCCYQS